MLSVAVYSFGAVGSFNEENISVHCKNKNKGFKRNNLLQSGYAQTNLSTCFAAGVRDNRCKQHSVSEIYLCIQDWPLIFLCLYRPTQQDNFLSINPLFLLKPTQKHNKIQEKQTK